MPDYIPVEYDPFASEQFVNPVADRIVRGAAGLATLPQRAIDAAAAYQPGSGEIPNELIGSSLEAAMLPMGGGVPVRAGETVLGAGPVRLIRENVPPPKGYSSVDTYALHDDDARLGHMLVDRSDPRRPLVMDIDTTGGPNSLGGSAVRSVGRQLQQAYPNAAEISGFRTSGARPAPAMTSVRLIPVDHDPIF